MPIFRADAAFDEARKDGGTLSGLPVRGIADEAAGLFALASGPASSSSDALERLQRASADAFGLEARHLAELVRAELLRLPPSVEATALFVNAAILMLENVTVIDEVAGDRERDLDRGGVRRADAVAPIVDGVAGAVGVLQRHVVEEHAFGEDLAWQRCPGEFRCGQDTELDLMNVEVVILTGEIDELPALLGRRIAAA